MIRVAFLTPSLHIGGAERWILSLARHFVDAQAVDVVLCAPHFHPDIFKEAAQLMPVFAARQLGDPEETRRLLAQACRRADVLITWGIPRLATVTHGLRLPVIDVSHSDGAWQQQTKMVRRASGGANFHVAVSRAALGAFPAGVAQRAVVIYNGAEVHRVSPRRGRTWQRAQWGVTEKDRVALFLGRFDEVKGPLRLIDALPHLPAEWKAVFHGHGPLLSQLRSRAQKCEQRCRILAPVSQVGDALAAADVLVMPSRHEGMPLSLVEAWLAGLPAVTTRFAFVEEAQRMHGPLGTTVPLNATAEQLADAISNASSKHACRAREVAWNRYTAAAMAQRWEEFLQAVLAS